MHEYILSTIFISIKIMPANMANIVTKVAKTLLKTLKLISCETSLSRGLKPRKPVITRLVGVLLPEKVRFY
ncbi:hypothetical protein CLOSCI_03086 [[Clostridium] scindens ATCC 35704]|nr:hypothetical protein CLOSCI_03086 [[Clostridium] scindens ATCC 35704]